MGDEASKQISHDNADKEKEDVEAEVEVEVVLNKFDVEFCKTCDCSKFLFELSEGVVESVDR